MFAAPVATLGPTPSDSLASKRAGLTGGLRHSTGSSYRNTDLKLCSDPQSAVWEPMVIRFAVTGIVLFVTPPGRVAHWPGWRLPGLGKDRWSAPHIWFALLFLIASGFHTWLNWRTLLGYFTSRLTHQFPPRREWTPALAICGVVTAGRGNATGQRQAHLGMRWTFS
jgi:hypothetical protein